MYIRNLIRKGLIAGLTVILLAGFVMPLFAGNMPSHLIPSFQGIVMENDGTSLVVSERKVLIKNGTHVMNSEKRPIKLSDIKAGNHVYVKGEFENEESDVIVAEKIYLLPRYITNKELDQFPFMKGKE
jgi:hypothetical protein